MPDTEGGFLCAGIFFIFRKFCKGHNVVWRTLDDIAEFLQRQHGNIFSFLKGVQRLIVDTGL